ncbi:MAG: sensor histidine kinase [Streptosporangiaceae bacterium]
MASVAGSGGGVRQAVRHRLNRTPLRVKLTTAVLVLVGVALAVISVAGMLIFGGYLRGRADSQLTNQYHEFLLAMHQNSSPFGGPPGVQFGQIYVQGPYIQTVRLQGHQLSPDEINRYSPGYRIALPDVTLSQGWVKEHAGRLVTVPGLNSPDNWRVITAPVHYYLYGPRVGTLIIAYDLGDISASVGRLAIIDAIIGGLALVGLAVIGVAVVRASLRPLSDIERTAQQIAAGDLGRRVPETDLRTEVGSLGRSLNMMLAQIETAFQARTASEEAARMSEEAATRSALAASSSEERMRRFVADASHELRTPLTAIRGFAEYYRQRGGVADGPGSGNGQPSGREHSARADGKGLEAAVGGRPDGPLTSTDLDRIIERVESEAARMGVLVDDLLLLARLDQQRPLDFRTVDLLALAADALHDARLIAPNRTINLTVATPEAPLVTGDEAGLRQVVGNLIGNALTHTPAATPVDITIRSGSLGAGPGPGPAAPRPAGDGEPAIILEVSDQGGGLSGEQKDHVFERFYRVDRARSRAAGGTGLGLAIVAAMVGAHHGQVWVDSAPGQGATFGFALPLAPEARPAPASPASPA